MVELGPVEPVAATIASFRSMDLNKKSETEYQDIFRKAIKQMFIRAITHKKRTLNSPTLSTPISAPPDDISKTGAGIARNLARVILPALKEKISLLPVAMNPFLMRSGSPMWFEAILDNLVAIDKLLEEIDSSIIMIWRTWAPNQDENPSYHHLSYFRGKMITYQTVELLSGPFCTLLIDCDKFFDNFSFSTPSSDNHSIFRKWDNIATRTNTSLENIDGLIQCIQKPVLAAAKDEWREVVDQIDELIKPLLKQLNPGYNPSLKGDDSESDEEVEVLSATGLRFARIGIPLLKMCRLLFNKLSQASSSQPLIFSGPSMEMDEATLREILVLTNEATTLIYEYAGELSKSPSYRRGVIESANELSGGMVCCWSPVERYLDGLLASRDPRVNKESVANARQWLKDWVPLYYTASANIMEATGCRFVIPHPDDEPDTEVDDEEDEEDDDWEDEDEEGEDEEDEDEEDEFDEEEDPDHAGR